MTIEKPIPSSNMTIFDIAEQAGVSVSTVSRILNDKPDVAESTRRKVLDIIEQTGYVPHLSARSLAAKRSRTIGLLFKLEYTSLTQLELDFFVGAAAVAEQENYFLNLMTSAMHPNHLDKLYKSGQVDGIILMQIQMKDWRVEYLQRHELPFVMIGRREDNTDLHYIDLDFHGASWMAFEHLYKLGHRHIGFMARPKAVRQAGLGAAVRALQGYLDACDAFGVAPHYREPEFQAETVQDAMLDLLTEAPKLSAIIASNGASAVPIQRVMSDLGREVPQDFSIIAVTTDKIANLVTPPLTSIKFPTNNMGYQAANMLIKLLEDDRIAPQQVLLDPHLTIRESTR